MKGFFAVFSVSVWCVLTAHAVQVEGYAYLSGGGYPAGIEVLFLEASPSAQTDSAYTDGYGFFQANLQPGVYDVEYSHAGHATYRLPNQVLLWDTTLGPVTLMPPLSGNLSGFIGPGDFQVIDSIVVGTAETLVIRPGTRLFLEPGVTFIVRGALWAVGTSNDSIVFTHRVIGQDSLWGGIQVLNASGNCRMVYCVVEYGNGRGGEWWPHGGGGIYCESSDLTLFYNSFRHNRVYSNNFGSGALLSASQAEIAGCHFVDNRGAWWGGGIFCYDSEALLNSCHFEGNSASYGGGIMLYDSSYARITHSYFMDNEGTDGTGIYVSYDCEASISNCLIETGLEVSGSAIEFSGTGDTEMLRCTVVCYGPADAVVCEGSACIISSTSIAAYHPDGHGIFFQGSSGALVQYSDLYSAQGNALDFYWDGGSANGPPAIGVIALTNANGDSCDTYYNIFTDPLFVDTAAGDYHLHAWSPCIDAGDPELEPDPDGTVADIGAFYYNQLDAKDPERTAVRHYELFQNYPNPFNSTTQITFDLTQASDAELVVFDVQGRRVTTLFSGRASAGQNRVMFSADDLPSGIYFCQLVAGDFRQTRKLVLMR